MWGGLNIGNIDDGIKVAYFQSEKTFKEIEILNPSDDNRNHVYLEDFAVNKVFSRS